MEEFYTKVVGVTYKNDDGSNRQRLITSCKPGDSVQFRNVYVKDHPEALAVFCGQKQLGFLSKDLAVELLTTYNGKMFGAEISEITGGDGVKNYGCNLHVVIFDNENEAAEFDKKSQQKKASDVKIEVSETFSETEEKAPASVPAPVQTREAKKSKLPRTPKQKRCFLIGWILLAVALASFIALGGASEDLTGLFVFCFLGGLIAGVVLLVCGRRRKEK